jgi:signal transduction histidine kinase
MTGEVTLYQYDVLMSPDSVSSLRLRNLGPVASLGSALSQPQPASGDAGFDLPLQALRQISNALEATQGVPAGAQKGVEIGAAGEGVVLAVRQQLRWPVAIGLSVLAGLVSIIGALVVQNRRVTRSRAVLFEASKAAVDSREAERVRVAREIHDGPLQQALALALAGVEPDRTGALADELRSIAEGMRPPSLEEFGLGSALEAFLDKVAEDNPEITVVADVQPEGDEGADNDLQVDLAMYRIAQEAVNNAIEHAQPSLVVVRIERGGPVKLEVTNDGVPFSWPKDLASLRRDGHFGLVGIAERVELLGAKFEAAPYDGSGTRLVVEVPLQPA